MSSLTNEINIVVTEKNETIYTTIKYIHIFSSVVEVSQINWRADGKILHKTVHSNHLCTIKIDKKYFIENFLSDRGGQFDYIGDNLFDYIGTTNTGFGNLITNEKGNGSKVFIAISILFASAFFYFILEDSNEEEKKKSTSKL